MNTYADAYIDEYITMHQSFTTEDLRAFIKSRRPKQVPPSASLGHYLRTHPLLEGTPGNPYTWHRKDMPAGMQALLRTVWMEGAVPMHELRERYGPAVDRANDAGMICRGEDTQAVAYLLTRRGITYARGLVV